MIPFRPLTKWNIYCEDFSRRKTTLTVKYPRLNVSDFWGTGSDRNRGNNLHVASDRGNRLQLAINNEIIEPVHD